MTITIERIIEEGLEMGQKTELELEHCVGAEIKNVSSE